MSLRATTEEQADTRPGETPASPWPEAPYKGLISYGREDVALFAGREIDVRRCAGILASPQTKSLLLHGKTGCGKSSFLRAGLIPTLEATGVGFEFRRSGSSQSWTHVFTRCTDAPLDRLAESVYQVATAGYERESPDTRDLIDLSEVTSGQTLAAFQELARRPGFLSGAVRLLSEKLPVTLVLVLDQAEEVLTLRPGEEGEANRRAFFEFLRDFNSERVDAKIIIALRTEFYGRFYNAMSLSFSAGAAEVKQYELSDLSRDDIVRAITRPTEKRDVAGHGIPFDTYRFDYAEGVADQIATDLIRSRDEGVRGGLLPLMQLTCRALFDGLPSDGVREITLAQYKALGRVRGSLDKHVNASIARAVTKQGGFHRFGGHEERLWHLILSKLFSVSDDGTVTTRLRSRDELDAIANEAGTRLFVQPMLEALAQTDVGVLRRVTVLEPEGEVEKFSLGHDAVGLSLLRWRTEDGARRKASQRQRALLVVVGVLALGGVVIGVRAGIAWLAAPRLVTIPGLGAPSLVDFENGQLPPSYSGTWVIARAGEGTETRGAASLVTPTIGDGMSASFDLKPGAGLVDFSFKYFTDTEMCCDHLTVLFDKQELEPKALTAQDSWREERFELLLAGPDTVVTWEFRKDGSVSVGRDRVWVDDIQFTIHQSEAFEVLDFESGTLPAGYVGDWEVSDAGLESRNLRSPRIGDNGLAAFEVPVPPGAEWVSFRYRTDTEPQYDTLSVRFGDQALVRGLASVEWATRVYRLSGDAGSGGRRVRWEYSKDSSVSEGEDRVWVDDITFGTFAPQR